MTHDKQVLQSLENLSKWFGKRYNIEWRELMSEAWIRMETYNTKYVSVAVRQAAHSYIRNEVKHSALSLDFVPMDIEDGATVPSWYPQTMDEHDIEWLDLFERSTRTLTNDQRMALYLWVVGATPNEIAESMNTSVDNAYKLVERGKERVRR